MTTLLYEKSNDKRKVLEHYFQELFCGKNVLFITTKNLRYIRNSQEIRLISESAKKTKIIGSDDKLYFKRLFIVYKQIFETNISEYDTIFIGFAPQLVVPILKNQFKNKMVIIDFFISFYDTLVYDRKIIKDNTLMSKLVKKIDIITIENSDHIIADTEAHKAYFCDEFHADSSKVSVLYLEADKSIYYPRESKEKRKNFKVLYFGSVLPLQGVEIVLDAANKISKYPDIQIEIIGPVRNKKKVITPNIIYVPWLSQEMLAERISTADICLAGHFNSEIEKANRTIPGKAYIYESMEKPMILGKTKANFELFSEKQDNVSFVQRGDSEALANVIVEKYELWKHISMVREQ